MAAKVESVPKSMVSVLQEYCAKQKQDAPAYEFGRRNMFFECTVIACGKNGVGTAKSKRDAKHAAAAYLIRQLQREGFVVPGAAVLEATAPEPAASERAAKERAATDRPAKERAAKEEVTAITLRQDNILLLQQYCERQQQPMPTFKISLKSYHGENEYFALVEMGSVSHRAKSVNEIGAKQFAAYQMLRHFKVGEKNEYSFAGASPSVAKAKDEQQRNTEKFNLYSKLHKTGQTERKDTVPLADRHMFFSRYPAHMKNAAFEIINSKTYTCEREQALDVLKALNLTPTWTEVTTGRVPYVTMELDCEFDTFFMDSETGIYGSIIKYFAIMLKGVGDQFNEEIYNLDVFSAEPEPCNVVIL